MPAKYHSKKVELDGHIFDSKVEARYYEHLKRLEKAGEILFFRLQPRYLLQPAFKKGGKTYRKIEYVADFEVHHNDGTIEVVDVKGIETEAFKIKKKLFNKIYPHKLSLVTYVKKYGGWIELDELKELRRQAKRGGNHASDHHRHAATMDG